jgi:spore coat protein U-like protein
VQHGGHRFIKSGQTKKRSKMKNFISIVSLLTFSIVFAGFSFAATVTGTLPVSATVVAACSVSTTPVNFGNQTGLTTATTTGDVIVNCSSSLPYLINLDAGANYTGGLRHIVNGLNSASYVLFQPDGTTPWGDHGFTIPANNLAETGSGGVQTWLVNATINTFTGLPDSTVLIDTVNVSVVF